MSHPNSRMTPAGRHQLILAIEGGASYREAASMFCVAISTISTWVNRWRDAAEHERASRSCLADRSSRPRRSPRLARRALERRVLKVRKRTGWGPRLIAGDLGMAHQAVWKILNRLGHSRKPPAPREVAHRYEWPCPGDLLHMDTSRYPRFTRPGHKVTGDRRKSNEQRRHGPGYDFIHAIIDDHGRLAYAEIHSDEKAQTVTGFTERALTFYASHGIAPKRLMTDNSWEYVNNRSLKDLLDRHGITHKRTRPYRPQTNGKIERFHQTMATEWAYGMTYASARARARALAYWLGHYNERRPHSALAGKAPISRVRSEPLWVGQLGRSRR